MAKNNSGKIIVYYGRGEGKTSASLGRAVRMAGRRKKVIILQFMKGPESGEHKFFKNVGSPIEIHSAFSAVKPEFLTGKNYARFLANSEKTLSLARRIVREQKCSLLVLDEILYALGFKLLKEKDILNLLENRGKVHVILTGGYQLPRSIFKIADQISEIKKVKHYFNRGQRAIKGLDL